MSGDAAIVAADKQKIIDILKKQEAGKADSYYEGLYNFYLNKISDWFPDYQDKPDEDQATLIASKYKAYSDAYVKDQAKKTNQGASTSTATTPPAKPQTPPAVVAPAVVTPAPATDMKTVAAAGQSNSGSTGSKSFDKSKQSYKNDDGTTNKYILCAGIALAVLVGGGIAYTVYKSQKRVRNEPMIVN